MKGGKFPSPPKIRCQCSKECHRAVERGQPFCDYHLKHGCPIKPALSGSEPLWYGDEYNKDPAVRHSHNCYAFGFHSINGKKVKNCREKNVCRFPVPGKLANHPEFTGNMGKTCGDVLGRTMADNPGSYLTDFQTQCKPGFTKLGVIVDDKRDFHYVPQFKQLYVPELKRSVPGLFGHKPGAQEAVIRDGAGSVVYNPELAYWYYPPRSKGDDGLYYNHSCGFLCRPVDSKIVLEGGKKTRRRRN